MEALNLTKGERVDLTKTHPGLKKVNIGLGWDVGGTSSFDLDGFAILLHGDKYTNPKDMIYFSNLEGDGVKHHGDNLTGAGEGDDETISLEFEKVKADAIVVGCNIYQAEGRKQNFGQVKNAFIRVYNPDTKEVLAKYDLSEDFSGATGIILGKVYNKDGEWKFQAVGEGRNGDLNKIADTFK